MSLRALLFGVLIGSGVIFLYMSVPLSVNAQDADAVARQKAAYEEELRQIEIQIAAQEVLLQEKQRERTTYERDLAIIDGQIYRSQLEINKADLAISLLGGEINKKTETISSLDDKVGRGQKSLAQLIRLTNKIDDLSSIEILLSNEDFSTFFEDIDSFVAIKRAMQESFVEIREVQVQTGAERAGLREKQRAELDAREVILAEQRKIEIAEAEKQRLLRLVQEDEQTYEEVIDSRERRAAEIRSALFALRDSAAIPFGDALDYANYASSKTGVRPALILAVLQQESSFGENIGSCYLRDTSSGDGVGKNTGRYFSAVMKPTRDVAPFLEITDRLGLDPFNTPVSCPIAGAGYGGAMGPSQFIPSTWEIFKDRIANAVGVRTANPWNPQHAVMATAIYMSDLGADRGGYSAETNAACRYYSGRLCDSRRPANTFYGESVFAKAEKLQETINTLERY